MASTGCLTCGEHLPYVCGTPEDPTGGHRCLLVTLVREVNAYNDPHMLDGYLDTLGTDTHCDDSMNAMLEAVGVPIIEQVGDAEPDED